MELVHLAGEDGALRHVGLAVGDDFDDVFAQGGDAAAGAGADGFPGAIGEAGGEDAVLRRGVAAALEMVRLTRLLICVMNTSSNLRVKVGAGRGNWLNPGQLQETEFICMTPTHLSPAKCAAKSIGIQDLV